MTPDSGALTTILQGFLDVFRVGVGSVQLDARVLLKLFVVLEISFLGLWWALSPAGESLVSLFRKVLTIGFFIWLIDGYPAILDWVIRGFTHTGEIASGKRLVSIEDPSRIIDLGFAVCAPAFERARASVGWSVSGLVDALINLFCVLVTLSCYCLLAIQVFVTRVEFGLISTLGLIFVPFGVFKQTSFLAEKLFGAVVAFGVRLMVLAFIVEVGFPFLGSYSLPEAPSWIEMLSIVVPPLSLLMLSFHAPGIAGGLLSGVPSLSAGSAPGARVLPQIASRGAHDGAIASGALLRGVSASGAAGASSAVSKALSSGTNVLEAEGSSRAQAIGSHGDSKALAAEPLSAKEIDVGGARSKDSGFDSMTKELSDDLGSKELAHESAGSTYAQGSSSSLSKEKNSGSRRPSSSLKAALEGSKASEESREEMTSSKGAGKIAEGGKNERT